MIDTAQRLRNTGPIPNVLLCRQAATELEALTHERDDLKAKLEKVEATAKRRLELLRRCEWPSIEYGREIKCPICRSLFDDGHKPDCPLAAELKATP